MVDKIIIRKKATLTPKIYQGLISNVKESFYLVDYTKSPDYSVRNYLTNYQIEQILTSTLFGTVILLNFRNLNQDLKFENSELSTKYSYANLLKTTITIELEGPKVAIPGTN